MLLVRRKILRLTREVSAKRGSHNVLTTGAFVACETQNFASHEEVSTKRDNHNVLTVGVFVARETQDFASLLWWTAILYSGNWDGIMVA